MPVADAPAQLTLDDLLPASRPEWEDATISLFLLPVSGGLPPDKDLVDDVRRWGVIEPVVLLDLPGVDGYRVADGRRRIQAARLVGLTDVPARILRLGGFAEPVLTLSCNARRSANPASELAAIEALMTAGCAEQIVSQATGLAVGSVRRRLRLATLVDALRDAFDAGRIGVAVAEAAARLPVPAQDRLVAVFAEHEKLTMADVAAERTARAKAAADALPDDLFAPLLPRPATDAVGSIAPARANGYDPAWVAALIGEAEKLVARMHESKTVVSRAAILPIADLLIKRVPS